MFINIDQTINIELIQVQPYNLIHREFNETTQHFESET